MRSSIMLSALYLACSSVPALALTEGQAWVNFYEECPSEIVEIEAVTFILSSIESNSGERVHSASAPIASSSIRATPARSSSVMLASSALASASTSTSASATPSSMKSQSNKSSSSNHSRRSKFRSVLATRSAEKETTLSPPVNITQGECQAVPIATAKHIDSSSVSVGGQLLTVTPFQECNITLHEVPGCIDEPLLVAAVKNRVAQSSCTPRNFGAFNDVWVRLDCSEIGTGSKLEAAEMSDSIIQSAHRIS